jgi:hypothetical protein
MSKGLHAAALAAGLLGAGTLAAQAPAPRLVVMITVDQLSVEYFARYSPQFTGGL